ncbi:PAS domain-containing protein [Dyella jejuensis]|uniref:histidine kinase n=1 Tax=Dyella jejuensis TaxID=1432009 RepID=A0ABW8JGD6_9GAMM
MIDALNPNVPALDDEQQAVLLRLADLTRPLSDPAEIQQQVTRLLGERLAADRVYYCEIDQANSQVIVAHDFVRPGVPSMVGRYPLAAFDWVGPSFHMGQHMVVDNTYTSPLIPDDQRAAVVSICIGAFIAIPLIKDNRLVAALCVTELQPRAWARCEVELVEEAAERTWDAVRRAKAEAALHDSEERFRQFADASSNVLWIRDARTLELEFVSPAFEAVYGMKCDAVMHPGDVRRWATLVVPDDRDAVLAQWEKVRNGQSVVHEFRIMRPSDGSFRWIRNNDFPLKDEHGQVQRIAGVAADISELKQSAEHQAILLAELQHRVRNIMAMIQSLVVRTGRHVQDIEEYSSLLTGRLMALARTQTLLTRSANRGVDIESIVRDELSAQAMFAGQYTVAGASLVIPPKAAEVLTLAVHELTTNSLKYGALSSFEGRVTVKWDAIYRDEEPWLSFRWHEEGIPKPAAGMVTGPQRRGFGTELIERRIPYELGGSGVVAIEGRQAHCRIEFPLRQVASILSTDAPARATIFGGALDMAGEMDLSGASVLVLEDDFYLAGDAERALKKAGAAILGPFASEAVALDEIAREPLSAALLDINLGNGPTFEVAHVLHTSGVPFVFITGYDDAAIPSEFCRIERLRKPVDLKQMVRTLVTALS